MYTHYTADGLGMNDLQATVVFWLVVVFWWVVPALLYLVFWLGRLGLIDNFRAIRGHMTYCKRCDRPSRCHCYWGKEHLSWEPCEACRIAACVVERLRQQ